VADPDSQQAGDWTPEFDGQRPPFRPGHEHSLVHGAYSERRVGPLAEQFAAELLASADTPAHIQSPLFAAAVHAWARAEAVVTLLWRYLEEQDDIAAAMTETSTGIESEEAADKGNIKRRSAAKRVASVLSELHRAESRALSARARLGLDPASASRIARDMATGRWMEASTPLDAAVAAIAEHRQRALGSGGAADD